MHFNLFQMNQRTHNTMLIAGEGEKLPQLVKEKKNISERIMKVPSTGTWDKDLSSNQLQILQVSVYVLLSLRRHFKVQFSFFPNSFNSSYPPFKFSDTTKNFVIVNARDNHYLLKLKYMTNFLEVQTQYLKIKC